jgi:hypothetical protein
MSADSMIVWPGNTESRFQGALPSGIAVAELVWKSRVCASISILASPEFRITTLIRRRSPEKTCSVSRFAITSSCATPETGCKQQKTSAANNAAFHAPAGRAARPRSPGVWTFFAQKIPKGFRPTAQGCEARATLGKCTADTTTPTGLRTEAERAATPLGLGTGRMVSQGSSCLATLGFGAESRWDSRPNAHRHSSNPCAPLKKCPNSRDALPRSPHLPCATKAPEQHRPTRDCWFMVAMHVEKNVAFHEN